MSSTKETLGRTQPTPHRVVSEIRKRYAAGVAECGSSRSTTVRVRRR